MTQVMLSMCELQDKGKGPYIEISTLLSEYLVIQVQEGIKSNVQIVLHALAVVPGRVAQLVTCLATDTCLTADPGVASSIPARYHTFVEIDHEIISTVILLPSADLFKKGCCQLQAKVCAQITG